MYLTILHVDLARRLPSYRKAVADIRILRVLMDVFVYYYVEGSSCLQPFMGSSMNAVQRTAILNAFAVPFK